MRAVKRISITLFLCAALKGSCISPAKETAYDPVISETGTVTVTSSQSFIPSKTSTPSSTLSLTRQVAEAMLESTRVVQIAKSADIQEKLGAIKPEFSEICESHNLSLSPDENWLAQDCFSTQFQVSSREGSHTIVISYEDIAKLTGDTLSISNVQPLLWTKDGRYLFFTQHVCCIDTDAFGWDGALFRLSLATGEWSRLVSGYSNYFSFSPDERMLVHIPHDVAGAGMPVVVNVIDTRIWSQKRILLSDYEQAGSLVWAPDESAFAITSKIGNYYAGGEVFSVIVVDVSSGSSKIIFTQGSRFIGSVGWSEDSIVTLVESCNQLQVDDFNDCANQFMFYDLNSETFR